MTDDPGDDLDRPKPRTEVARSEARTVLDRQYEDLADVDEVAMRTTRITAILLGVLVSVVQVSRPNDGGVSFHVEFAAVSGLLLLCSLAAGVLTYNLSSDLVTGPSTGFLARLVDGDLPDDRWDRRLVEEYERWIEDNDAVIEYNGDVLFVTHALLVGGLAFAGLSVVAPLTAANWALVSMLLVVVTGAVLGVAFLR